MLEELVTDAFSKRSAPEDSPSHTCAKWHLLDRAFAGQLRLQSGAFQMMRPYRQSGAFQRVRMRFKSHECNPSLVSELMPFTQRQGDFIDLAEALEEGTQVREADP